MLNDFVTGTLGCERARAIVPAVTELVDAARKKGIPVIFCNDAHFKGVDKELQLWGDHAIADTEGAKVIPELAVSEKDYIIPKHRYSGFFATGLNELLRELGVETVILAGIHAHLCVVHTAADAYQYGYGVVAASEAIDAFTEQDYRNAMEYMKSTYGAEVLTNEEIIRSLPL